MATNTYNITTQNNGQSLPLRGDMAATLNFVPTNPFFVVLTTEDANTYTVTSTGDPIMGLDGVKRSTFSMGGFRGAWGKFMHDAANQCWKLSEQNLMGGGSGGGTPGPAGEAATISVGTVQTVDYSTGASVTNVGTPTAAIFNFKIPSGPAGTGGGTTLPAGGTAGQYLVKTGPNAADLAWAVPTGTGGSGGGTSTSPEVVITQDSATGNVTVDKAVGRNFRVTLTRNGKLVNPVGFGAGETFNLIVVQGAGGPWSLEVDRQWAVADQLPLSLATAVGAENWITCYATAGPKYYAAVTPQNASRGFGVITAVARNLTTGIEYYALRSPSVPGGMTDMRPNQTLKILRDARGIEAYGALDGNQAGAAGSGYLISGALPDGGRANLYTGAGVRTAFDRGVMAFGGPITATVRDIQLGGAREQSGASHIAQSVSLTGAANVTLRNVRMYDSENGVLSANDYTGTFEMFDCVLQNCGVGDFGFTHNIYMGHHLQGWSATRTSFIDCEGGHNIKSRAGTTTLKQVRCANSKNGRELDVPNGGILDAQDCVFDHAATANQNDCVRIVEGFDLDTARPRGYTFRNCHFKSMIDIAKAGSFIWNNDPDTPVYCIDCTFEGPNGATGNQWAGADVNGMVGNVIIQYTGGPVGPRAPAGYQVIATTPV